MMSVKHQYVCVCFLLFLYPGMDRMGGSCKSLKGKSWECLYREEKRYLKVAGE